MAFDARLASRKAVLSPVEQWSVTDQAKSGKSGPSETAKSRLMLGRLKDVRTALLSLVPSGASKKLVDLSQYRSSMSTSMSVSS